MEQKIIVSPTQQPTDKICFICNESVLKKHPSERCFGILEYCEDVFCMSCIRKWRVRGSDCFKLHRKCPACYKEAEFVIPSNCWYDTAEGKRKIIANYKAKLSQIPCRFFTSGSGNCKFGEKCIYQHSKSGGPAMESSGSKYCEIKREEAFSSVGSITCHEKEEYVRKRIKDIKDSKVQELLKPREIFPIDEELRGQRLFVYEAWKYMF